MENVKCWMQKMWTGIFHFFTFFKMENISVFISIAILEIFHETFLLFLRESMVNSSFYTSLTIFTFQENGKWYFSFYKFISNVRIWIFNQKFHFIKCLDYPKWVYSYLTYFPKMKFHLIVTLLSVCQICRKINLLSIIVQLCKVKRKLQVQ